MVYTAGPFDRLSGYIQWGGALPGPETWSCGLRVASDTTVDGDVIGWDIPTLLDYYTTQIQTMHASAVSLAQSAKLQFVKFNRIDRNGHYLEATTSENVFPDVPGGTGGVGTPNQIALAVSLTTSISRGPAHRGRIYLPTPALAIAGDGRMSQAYVDAAAAAMKTFLDAMNTPPADLGPASPHVVVMSRKAGAPTTRRVTGVAIGRVLDTQRRRRRSLKEAYSVLAL